jgi:hypothetical protein
MTATIIQFPIERARPGSDGQQLFADVWRGRRMLNAADWVFVIGIASTGDITQRDNRRLRRMATALRGARR